MKKRDRRDEHETDMTKSSKFMDMKRRKNMKRLGGGGLSLEAFANLKSTSNRYNPAFIKKQRESNKNAKYVSKFKRSLKQQNQQKGLPSSQIDHQDVNKTRDSRITGDKQRRSLKKKNSLEELYRKKHEEEEKARMEREATLQAKKEERETAEARRKAAKEKLLKKTRHGQPVMKYRIEHLLESIQSSVGNSQSETI